MEDPSPLELGLLRVFHELYGSIGFPDASNFRVRGRANTGAGRYVDLWVTAEVATDDVLLDLGGRYVEMDGVPYGLMAVIHVDKRIPKQMEIAVYGEFSWDGVERAWSIV
jgi:hypothetical protein